jgi:hypothetical protein
MLQMEISMMIHLHMIAKATGAIRPSDACLH